jgi:hypothetical protein
MLIFPMSTHLKLGGIWQELAEHVRCRRHSNVGKDKLKILDHNTMVIS